MDSRGRKNNLPRQFSAFKHPALALFILVAASLSCVLDVINPPPPPPTLTPAPQTGTDFLSYTVQNYTYTLLPGQSLPGTGLKYESGGTNEYTLNIDNRPQPSSGSTHVIWFGTISPGIFANYDLQIAPIVNTNNLNAAGVVKLVLVRPIPSELSALPANISTAVHYSGILVGETALVGQEIAGTTLHYDGESNGAAAFSGTFQSGLRPLNTPFIWYGQLLNNVYVRHNLTVTSITADAVRLEGTADIYVVPNR